MTDAPALVALLVLTGAVYARGATRLGRPLGRSVAFYGGLAVLAGALLSPLERSFSAHMVQHLLLMMVAAPLLAYGRPAAALFAGLPAEARAAVRSSAGSVRPVGQALANPVVVWATGAVVLWAWHMPALYEAALSHDAAHAAEHLSFFGAALLFWAVVLGSGRRHGVGRPVALLLVLATAIQGAALGAVLALASRPLYPSHPSLQDQQLAGALMWSPPGLLYVGTMAWLLLRWFDEMEDRLPVEATR